MGLTSLESVLLTSKVNMRKQIRSIMCGCGNCATRLNVADVCPQGTSKEAIWLWHSDPNDKGDVDDEVLLDQVMEIIEELTKEPQEVVL
jgi:hypothetical protein